MPEKTPGPAVEATAPRSESTPQDGNPREWRRPPFFATLAALLVPLLILVAVNLVMLGVVHVTGDETDKAIGFWYSFVDFNRDVSIPSWLNAGLWMLAGLVAGYIARKATALRKSWWIFAAVCVYLSIDEAVSLHELLEPLGRQAGTGLAYAWVIPGLAITAIVVLALGGLVLRLPPTSRNALLIGGVVFLLGSVGIETIAGFVSEDAQSGGLYALLGVFEEGCEIVGVAICVTALLSLLERRDIGTARAYRVALNRSP